MTALEWLKENGKKPYHLPCGPSYMFWYWGLEGERTEPNDEGFLLPAVIFNRLNPPTEYPSVKYYDTEKEALEDFCRVFDDTADSKFQTFCPRCGYTFQLSLDNITISSCQSESQHFDIDVECPGCGYKDVQYH